ncbi:hypothetical protein [Flavobacterium beibuense]|uniref:Uncharacterized protein n=1 Tax=Flavobacterium beibuense TaxID=657326 RepID=A0A444WEQ0_9FLAO|nr:hypothetical protein [Flavobacterium beibuense]RYJ44246.1 hypothetical protein NU09_0856 [Flavobacterium beibuense]
MDYATPSIRAAMPAPKQKTKAAAQKRRAVPAVPKAQKGLSRGAFRPPAISPCPPAAYGFLNTRFLPQIPAQGTGCEKEKAGFYQNFALLCSHYGITPIATDTLPYPYGREVALHEARRLLREAHRGCIAIDFEKYDDGAAFLTAAESYATNSTLYYIPVTPLYQLMRQRRRKGEARLLLCILAYLYHIAGVPYYRDEGSYLYWNYEMLAQWIEDDPQDNDCPDRYAAEVSAASHIGQVMLRRLRNPVHLNNFGDWLKGFAPGDDFARQCAALAKRAFGLWQDYPEAHLYRHADTDCLPDPDDGYEDNDCITMEKYIGFVATTKGGLYESLEQCINSEFNECQYIQEPVLRRCFDGRTQQDDSLDFEYRLFPLIDDLCYILNNPDYDT